MHEHAIMSTPFFSETDSDFFVLGTEVKSPNLEKQQTSIQNFIKIH